MKLRDVIGLVLAIVLAIGVAILTRYFLVKEKSSETTQTEKKVQYNKILVATKDLYRGEVIQNGNLAWKQWPEESINESYIKEGAIGLDKLEGAIVKNSLAEGDPVTSKNIIKSDNKSILSALINPGMRAFSINVSGQSASSGLIGPGDFVDVLVGKLISPAGGGNNYGQGRLIISNVKVLAIDVDMSDKYEKPKADPHVATLEVTPDQAEKLAAAMKDGAISLSLHSMENLKESENIKQDEYGREDTVILMRGKEKIEVSVEGK